MKKINVCCSLLMLAFLTACVKDKVDKTVKNYSEEEYAVLQQSLNLPIEHFDYTLNVPPHLGGFPVSADAHMATLGRVLFYDKRLSSNKQVACASCHKQELAFSDSFALSKGVNTERTSRNSLALGAFPSFNGYYGFGGGSRLFWDERASSVMEQTMQTLKNPVEMGNTDMAVLAAELLNEDFYRILFEKAFSHNNFNNDEEKMLMALEAFVNSIGCFNTKYDLGMTQHPEFSNFNTQEKVGKELFKNNCESCHNLGAGFSNTVTVANNGLEMDYTDKGLGGVTQEPQDMDVFKVPMLRNVALTAPYMHDGRFATLDDVVEHYSTGVRNHPNLHENLKAGSSPKLLHLSAGEKAALVAFLHTLTDGESLAHERFSNPFK